MSDSYNTRIKLKRDTEANWTSLDPVLLDGEVAIVRMPDGETRKKIGDGTKRFSELPYDGGDFVQYAAQTLTDAQKKQARDNIGAASDFVVNAAATTTGALGVDKTFAQIQEAIRLGKRVLLQVVEKETAAHVFLRLSGVTPRLIEFSSSVASEEPTGSIAILAVKLSITSDGEVTLQQAPTPARYSDGSLQQIEMASEPTSAKQIATKQYVDDNKTVIDEALDAASENPVQNKAVKAALDGKLNISGGTLTGNLTGKYITGTWLQATATTNLHKTPSKIAVMDDEGWVYYRTPSEILNDIGGASKKYVDDHAGGGTTKVTLSGTVEGEVVGYTAATYQQIVDEIAKNGNIWLTVDIETIHTMRLASWKRSGSADYILNFLNCPSSGIATKYEVVASKSSASLSVTGSY